MTANEISPYSPAFWKKFSVKRLKKPGKRAMCPDCWDRAASTYDDLEQCPDYMRQVEGVLDELVSRGVLNNGARVLDVGCGTGTYAVRMAPRVKEVVALDVSKAMLEVLEKKVAQKSLDNIEVVQADWRRYRPAGAFDLVFASMTPIFRSLDLVDKLLDSSARHVALVSWAGVKENQLLKRLFLEIFGHDPQSGEQRPDMLVLFNYLYTRGYAPDLRFFHGCWKRRRSKARQLENMLWQMELYRPLSSGEKERAREIVFGTGEGDGIEVTTRVRTCLLVVDKSLLRHRCP